MNLLTEPQKAALDFQRHLSVTANAGSGKTMVLVKRFVNILLGTDAHMNELVAITFTEKAASELKKKIAEEIEERLRSARDAGHRYRLEELRSNLSFANISTIHSFCAKLLREYPVEAGVDAEFTVIEQVDQLSIEQEAIGGTMRRLLAEPSTLSEADAQLGAELRSIIRMMGRRKIESSLAYLLRKREQVERMLDGSGIFAPGADNSVILAKWEHLILREVERVVADPTWTKAAKRVHALAAGKKAEQVSELLNQWHGQLSIKEKARLFSEALSIILTNNGSIRRDYIGRNTDEASVLQEIKYLSSQREAVAEYLSGLDGLDASHRTLLRIVRILLGLYTSALGQYQRRKAENAALDFEDLQLYARKLLGSEEIRAALAARFKYILVDEYQDTNRLQYEILRPLISDFRSGNLFIVGDPKQSIYSFRNADVEVFGETKDDIVSHNVPDADFMGDPNREELRGRIVLGESFRLLGNIVMFVNYVFSRLMGQQSDGTAPTPGVSHTVPYEELIRGRNNNEPGRVEIMLTVEDDTGPNGDERKSDPIAAESSMIARRILALQQSQYPVFERSPGAADGSEAARPFRFRDAAILLRSRTHLQTLERALVDAKIPYLISGGIGFYQTQEILDFFNYFRFLLNSHDDVALVGVLRSPFFAISDAELFEISRVYGGEDFWAKARIYAQRDDAAKRVQRAVSILADDLLVAHRLSIPVLVQRILRQTGWVGSVAGTQRGVQSLANVQKLLRLAREFEGRGFTGLFDFVERLKTLTEDEEREGQAAADLSGDCVHIMTIHGAKGLEFPVVFIPFCHQKLRMDSPPYLDPELGIGIKIPDESDFDNEIEPPIYRMLKKRSAEKRIAEEKRVLYVACTRARDMLILSGNRTSRVTSNTYLGWVMDALEMNENDAPTGVLTIPNQPLKILDRSSDRYLPCEERRQLEVHLIVSPASIPQGSEAILKEEAIALPREFFLDPVRASAKGEFFSATQLQTFFECPSKYYLRYQLGLPENNRRPYDFDENQDPDDRILGELEGSLTHAVLANLASADVTDDFLAETVERALTATLFESDETKTKVSNAIFRNVRSVLHSETGRSILSAKEFFAEHTLSMVFGEDYLTGTLDRLFKTPEGLWSFVDYKTDAVSSEQVDRRAAVYRTQLALYALLVSSFFGQESVRGTVLFTRHPGMPKHFDFDKESHREFRRLVEAAITRIRANDFRRAVELCEHCTYRTNGTCLI